MRVDGKELEAKRIQEWAETQLMMSKGESEAKRNRARAGINNMKIPKGLFFRGKY